MNRKYFFIPSLLIMMIAGLLITSCGKPENQSIDMELMEQMPSEIQSAPEVVRSAYQFAVTNPDVLTQLPCYCGCSSMGHTSNYACYIAGENSVGSFIFDNHALGCSICVDITVDAMRMLDDGQSIDAIRSYVDQTYSAFGPSNMP